LTANPAATQEAKKLNVRINYGGREHPFHPDPDELVRQVREEAMSFFNIVADRDQLRLYKVDNTELDDNAAIGAYNLEKHETLILRQPTGGGGC
jgi:hypothetical protein